MAKENLGGTLLSIHNTRFLIKMMEEIRVAIKENRFKEYKEEFLKQYNNE